jgi:hypothetical protein
MAEQTDPIKRRVAVKVVKEGIDSMQVLARFHAARGRKRVYGITHSADSRRHLADHDRIVGGAAPVGSASW